MKQPDFMKMRLALCKDEDSITQEYIMDKMDNDDVMYQYIKAFGQHTIPTKEV
jgi:hypothetical protein